MITKEDIEKLAKLARIEVTREEAESLTKEIDSILGYVGQIKDATGGDSEIITPKLINVLRDDEVTNSPGEFKEKLLDGAPYRDGDYLKVKKIL